MTWSPSYLGRLDSEMGSGDSRWWWEGRVREAKTQAYDATQLVMKSPRDDLAKEILVPLLGSKYKERVEDPYHQRGHGHQTQVSDLPVQVFEKLALLLPIQSLSQARSVCKAWKGIISSPSFLSWWLDTFHNNCFLMDYSSPSFLSWWLNTVHDHCFFMGYPDGRQRIAVSDLAHKWHSSNPPTPPFSSPTHQVSAIHPLASDGGLVLYFCHGSHQQQLTTLCVFNPFTTSYRMLPPVDLVAQAVGRAEAVISTHVTGAAYLVFLVGFTRKPNKDKAGIVLSIYDSTTGRWVKKGITPADDSIAPGHWCAVHSNGVLYILSHVDGVICYDHARDLWGRVGPPLREIYVNGWLVHEKLVLHEGSLFLIGSTLERDDYTDELLHRLYIYRLKTQLDYVHWELFDRLPDEMMLQCIGPHAQVNHDILHPDDTLEAIDPRRFAEHNVLPVSCFQCEDVVLLLFHESDALVAFRLSTRVWTRISGWNVVQKEISEEFVSGKEKFRLPYVMFNMVGFKPSLAATH